MLEENCIANQCCSCFDDVDFETPMVLHRNANAEADFAVHVPGRSVFGFDVCVCHYQAPQGWERALHVIVLLVHVCMCRYFGHHVALATQVDGKFGGLDEVAPQRKGEPVVDSAEDHDEMVFERLDCLLCHVPLVAVGRYELVSHVVFFNALFAVFGALVV